MNNYQIILSVTIIVINVQGNVGEVSEGPEQSLSDVRKERKTFINKRIGIELKGIFATRSVSQIRGNDRGPKPGRNRGECWGNRRRRPPQLIN